MTCGSSGSSSAKCFLRVAGKEIAPFRKFFFRSFQFGNIIVTVPTTNQFPSAGFPGGAIHLSDDLSSGFVRAICSTMRSNASLLSTRRARTARPVRARPGGSASTSPGDMSSRRLRVARRPHARPRRRTVAATDSIGRGIIAYEGDPFRLATRRERRLVKREAGDIAARPGKTRDDSSHRPGLLPARCDRPRNRRTADKCDELPPLHVRLSSPQIAASSAYHTGRRRVRGASLNCSESSGPRQDRFGSYVFRTFPNSRHKRPALARPSWAKSRRFHRWKGTSVCLQ